MLISSKHHATKIELNCLRQQFLSQSMLDLYDCFNKERFDSEIDAPISLSSMCNIIYSKFEHAHPKINDVVLEKKMIQHANDKHVLLGFSAGLDSTYQAVLLKEAGYNVHLLFARNINTYENGQAWKYAGPIAKKLGISMLEISVKKDMRKGTGNPFKQHWPENPMKNQLILSVMLDICLENGWQYISLGDDFDLSLSQSVAGVNVTDAREVTMSFLNGVKSYVKGFKFIPIPKGHDKGERIQKMIDYNLQDDYYSCVQAGRLNKHFKANVEKKFNVKLFGNNCGTCRKCCMHNLILHYTGKHVFPVEFVAHCWEKMYKTGCKADYEFFKPELSLDERIKNLFTY